MEIKDVPIWKPIEFSAAWEQCSTSKLDVLLPSWVRRRQTLKEDSKAYNQFMDRLKRQHAIETGVIEKLYDLSEGVTETFIREGFVESYLQHGDTNIPPHQLMHYLNDNFSAIDFVFDVVKNNRTFTVSFIKELHQLITRHQDTAEGRDQFGTRLQIPLLKGKFKERENNPTRADGSRFLYCPPIHVDAEMDRLVDILADMEAKKVKPLLVATWLHHAFVIIHPFQDGNGRVARLLASLVLIKHGLFPLTVKRGDKKRYIDALELADNGEPQKLVDYFGEMQKKNIEGALNMRLEVDLSQTTLSEIASILVEKLELEKSKKEESMAFQKRIERNTAIIVSSTARFLEEVNFELQSKFSTLGNFFYPSDIPLQRDYTLNAISKFAHLHNYVFIHNHSIANIFSGIQLPEERHYRLLITIHNYGYEMATLAIGSLFFFLDTNFGDFEVVESYPSVEPLTISIDTEEENIDSVLPEIKLYVHDAMTLALAQIASEINP